MNKRRNLLDGNWDVQGYIKFYDNVNNSWAEYEDVMQTDFLTQMTQALKTDDITSAYYNDEHAVYDLINEQDLLTPLTCPIIKFKVENDDTLNYDTIIIKELSNIDNSGNFKFNLIDRNLSLNDLMSMSLANSFFYKACTDANLNYTPIIFLDDCLEFGFQSNDTTWLNNACSHIIKNESLDIEDECKLENVLIYWLGLEIQPQNPSFILLFNLIFFQYASDLTLAVTRLIQPEIYNLSLGLGGLFIFDNQIDGSYLTNRRIKLLQTSINSAFDDFTFISRTIDYKWLDSWHLLCLDDVNNTNCIKSVMDGSPFDGYTFNDDIEVHFLDANDSHCFSNVFSGAKGHKLSWITDNLQSSYDSLFQNCNFDIIDISQMKMEDVLEYVPKSYKVQTTYDGSLECTSKTNVFISILKGCDTRKLQWNQDTTIAPTISYNNSQMPSSIRNGSLFINTIISKDFLEWLTSCDWTNIAPYAVFSHAKFLNDDGTIPVFRLTKFKNITIHGGSYFEATNLEEIYLDGINMDNNHWAQYMFANCPNLKIISIPNFSYNESGAGAYSCQRMFEHSPKIEKIIVNAAAKPFFVSNAITLGLPSQWANANYEGWVLGLPLSPSPLG